MTTLKFGFPLSKGPARAAPASFTNDKPDVKATGQRLTMRGVCCIFCGIGRRLCALASAHGGKAGTGTLCAGSC